MLYQVSIYTLENILKLHSPDCMVLHPEISVFHITSLYMDVRFHLLVSSATLECYNRSVQIRIDRVVVFIDSVCSYSTETEDNFILYISDFYRLFVLLQVSNLMLSSYKFSAVIIAYWHTTVVL